MHERMTRHPPWPEPKEEGGPSYRILVIEDNPDHRFLEAHALTQRWGTRAHVVAVETAVEGLARLERESFDVVLADYHMPGMNGLELLRALRARSLDVPVILLTGVGSERIAVEALTGGAADYVIKETSYVDRLPMIVERTLAARRAAREMERARRQMEILYQLACQMNRTLDLTELMQILTRTAREALGIERATVYLLDTARETIADIVTTDVDPERARRLLSLKGRRIAEILPGVKWHEVTEPLLIPDVAASETLARDVVTTFDIRALLGVPIRIRGEVIAALFLSATQPRSFAPEEVALARALAEHAAAALEKARLYQEVQRRLFELNGLYGISRLLARILRPGEIYGEVTALIARLIGATRCIIATYDATRRELRAEPPGYGIGDDLVRSASYVVTDELKTFWDLRTHGPFLANRPEQIPSALQELASRFEVENLLATALVAEGKTLGVIFAFNKPGGFTPDDARLLSIFAHQTAQVLRTASLHEEIARAKEEYRQLFENANVGLYRSTRDGRILAANATLARIFGYPSAEELLTCNAAELWADPQKRPLWCDELERRGALEHEHRVRTRDGRTIWVRTFARTVRDAEGRVAYYEGALVDITEQRRAALEREAILQITQSATLTSSLEELFPTIHRAVQGVIPAENFFVALYEAQTGFFHFPYFVDQYDPPPPPLKLQKTATAYVFRTGVPHRLTREDCRRLVHEGEIEILGTPAACWVGVPLKTPKGTLGVLVVQHYADEEAYTERDVEFLSTVGNHVALIIERKRAEEAERKLREQLYQAQKMESIGALAGGIAHDFNNILTGMMGFAELTLMELGAQHAVAEHLRHILSLGARARDLIRQLLLFSRPAAGHREVCDLSALLSDVVSLLGRTLPENIQIELDMPAEACVIEVNVPQFQQVLLNIALNARDAMPQGGILRIEARHVVIESPAVPHALPGRFVRVTLEDTGHGIPPHILPHIFEPFFTTKEVGRGTGLGLAVAYGIIRAHGGWIDVQSDVGRGTRFSLYVPAATATLPARAAIEEEIPRGRETILLIEDETTILELGRQMLQSLGYRVLTARDGEEGVALYATHHAEIDLILLDVIMPRLSGREALRELRRINPRARVLLLTGYSPEHVAAELLASGALGVVRKPYEMKELARAVRDALDREPASSDLAPPPDDVHSS